MDSQYRTTGKAGIRVELGCGYLNSIGRFKRWMLFPVLFNISHDIIYGARRPLENRCIDGST
jgi:hypothetical protein